MNVDGSDTPSADPQPQPRANEQALVPSPSATATVTPDMLNTLNQLLARQQPTAATGEPPVNRRPKRSSSTPHVDEDEFEDEPRRFSRRRQGPRSPIEINIYRNLFGNGRRIIQDLKHAYHKHNQHLPYAMIGGEPEFALPDDPAPLPDSVPPCLAGCIEESMSAWKATIRNSIRYNFFVMRNRKCYNPLSALMVGLEKVKAENKLPAEIIPLLAAAHPAMSCFFDLLQVEKYVKNVKWPPLE